MGYTKKGMGCKKKPHKDSNYCGIHKTLYKFDKPDECPICMESMDEEVRPLDCGHWVHKKCILQWKNLCPTCKNPVVLTKKEMKILQNNTKIDHPPIEIFVTFNEDNTAEIGFDEWFNALINILEN